MIDAESAVLNKECFRTFASDADGNLCHAYLLFSDDAFFRKIFLKAAAKRIFSKNVSSENAICQGIEDGSYLDAIFFDGAEMKVKETAALIEKAGMQPLYGDRKVFCIDNADKLNAQSQNKLLKTYEEPPAYLTVIMASSNESGILQTIKSRAKKIYADGFTVKETTELLISEGFPKNQALVAASLGDGNMERAASFLSDEKYVKLYDACFEMLLSLENSTMIVDYLYGELFTKDNAALTSDILESIFSDVLKVACNVGLPLANSGREFDVKQIASKFNPQSAQEALFALNEGRKKLNFNVSSVRSAEGVLFDILEARYKWQ